MKPSSTNTFFKSIQPKRFLSAVPAALASVLLFATAPAFSGANDILPDRYIVVLKNKAALARLSELPLNLADIEHRYEAVFRSVIPTQIYLNRFKADFLLHRGWFRRGLATTARAFLSTD